MKKVFISIIIILFIISCNSKISKISSECEDYVTFIKSEWKFNDSTSTYFFKGNPKYWRDLEKYVNQECLLGSRRREIINLFGTPSQEIRLHDVQFITYCLDKGCLYSRGTKHKQISFFIDSSKVVGKVTVVPTDVPDFH